jgi:hypothetical protein
LIIDVEVEVEEEAEVEVQDRDDSWNVADDYEYQILADEFQCSAVQYSAVQCSAVR